MGDKKLPKGVLAQIKKACKLMSKNEWLISFDTSHTSIGKSDAYALVNKVWFHEAFEEYEITKLPLLNYEYHWATMDGVTFYCGRKMTEEGED